VMEVDEKRQRISLTMRLEEHLNAGPRPHNRPMNRNAAPQRPEPKRTSPRPELKPGGAIALALERAKAKK
jgi:transcriptional accessory protein Tex/SPT6